MMNSDSSEDQPVHLPINGVLDLHNFLPREVKDLVIDYLEECRKKKILEVRIIHGKGVGNLRRTVHSTLDKLDWVEEYEIAGIDGGSWGATLVKLLPPETC